MAAKKRSKKSRPKSSEKPVEPPKADGPYPYEDRMKRKPYERQLRDLQIELLKVQRWVKETGKKIVIVFEGRDAAGKGGTIKRFTEHLNPRGTRVVALPAPSEIEQGQWYFQRYTAHLPTRGEIVLFDRSWYNRAGVEPVMGFCTPDDYQRFIHQTPYFEPRHHSEWSAAVQAMVRRGSRGTARADRVPQKDPLKHWKLSPMDDASIAHWDDYTKARDGMFLYTDTDESPWTVIRSDDKKRARLGAIRTVLCGLDYPGKDTKVAAPPDPLIVGPVDTMIPLEGRFMFADMA
ncbi:MAG: polyphosphate kinase 2 [Pirellulales bacterium]